MAVKTSVFAHRSTRLVFGYRVFNICALFGTEEITLSQWYAVGITRAQPSCKWITYVLWIPHANGQRQIRIFFFCLRTRHTHITFFFLFRTIISVLKWGKFVNLSTESRDYTLFNVVWMSIVNFTSMCSCTRVARIWSKWNALVVICCKSILISTYSIECTQRKTYISILGSSLRKTSNCTNNFKKSGYWLCSNFQFIKTRVKKIIDNVITCKIYFFSVKHFLENINGGLNYFMNDG